MAKSGNCRGFPRKDHPTANCVGSQESISQMNLIRFCHKGNSAVANKESEQAAIHKEA